MIDKDKRKPTLADRFLTSPTAIAASYLERPYIDALKRKVRAAHKFVFDEEAATRIGAVVRDIPDLIVRECAFARPPFDLTWIEFPHWKFWRTLHPERFQDQHADHTIGYLIDGGVGCVVTGGTIGRPMKEALPGVFRYHLRGAEWDDAGLRELIAQSRCSLDQYDHYLWGSTRDVFDQATRDQLRLRFPIEPAPILSDSEHQRALLNDALKGSAGELRNIIAILLMLNRPTITRYGNQPPGRGWLKGKHIAFMAHTTVTIDMDPIPTLRLIGTPAGEGVPRRRHEVRGHYCHNREARDYLRIAGCIHEWVSHTEDWTPCPDAPDDQVDHWVCAECGGKRWWRADHERGDASVGYVTHDYRVAG